MKYRLLGSICVWGLLLGAAPPPASASVARSDHTPRLPLRFEVNAGQTAAQVRYLARGAGYLAFLTDDGATLRLFGAAQDSALRIRPLAMRTDRSWQAPAAEQVGPSTYYASVQQSKPALAVRDYAEVRQLGVWNGIDLRWHATADGSLEYDLELAAGADPAQVRFALDGADQLSIQADGSLQIRVGTHQLVQPAPVSWQVDAQGQRELVKVEYRLKGRRAYALAVANYDRARPLVIDPALLYGTYLGGSSPVGGDGSRINAVKVNAAGEVYVAGTTYAPDFPVNAGDQDYGSNSDAFVAKFAANGTRIWASFLGDSGAPNTPQTFELGTALAINADGTRIYLAGSIGFGLEAIAFKHNVFVVPINNPSGSTVSFVTPDIFGGNAAPIGIIDGDDRPTDIAIDSAGNVTVVGRTTSPDFPRTLNAIDPVYNQDQGDGFLRRYDTNFQVTTSSYFAFAQGNDYVSALTVGPDQTLTLTGTFFSATDDSLIYLSRLNNAATASVWFFTGDGDGLDIPSDIKVDATGRAFVVGTTNSGDFSTGTNPPPLDGSFGGELDAFLLVVKANGSAIDTATYLGGPDIEIATGLYLAGNGEVRITGTRSGIPATGNDIADIFVLSLNPTLTGVTRQTAYLGNAGVSDFASDIAVASDGSYWVAGRTDGNFRVTSDAFQPTRPGSDVNGVLLHLREANPVISVADLSLPEGNSGSTLATFRVRLDALNTAAVSVAYTTTNGTATAGSDYTASSGTLTFDTSSNSLERTVNVAVQGDTTFESSETFRLVLSAPSGASIGDGDATATIVNDDAAPATLQFSQASYSLSEGAGQLNVTVSRLGPLTNTASVNYATSDGTASAGSDYSASNGPLFFAVNASSASFNVPISSDFRDEDNETFSIALSSPSGANLGTPASVTVTITDDDNPPTLSVENGGCTVTEGNSGSTPCNFVLRLSAASGKTINFNSATANGSASSGSDYTGHSSTPRSIPVDQTTLTIAVPVLGDSNIEASENFTLNLSGISNAMPATLSATGTIDNDDQGPLPDLLFKNGLEAAGPGVN